MLQNMDPAARLHTELIEAGPKMQAVHDLPTRWSEHELEAQHSDPIAIIVNLPMPAGFVLSDLDVAEVDPYEPVVDASCFVELVIGVSECLLICRLEAPMAKVEGHGYDSGVAVGPCTEYIHFDVGESLNVVPESLSLLVEEGPFPQVLHVVNLLPVQAFFLEAEAEGILNVLEPQQPQASDVSKSSVHLFEQILLEVAKDSLQ